MSNPTGRDDFERIAGEHLAGANDNTVSYVIAEHQSSLVLPSVICRQFGGLVTLDLVFNNISEVNEDTFRYCGFLQDLLLMSSQIRHIPNRTFQNARNLRRLYLDVNGIETIGTQAFSGEFSGAMVLDLNIPNFRSFDPWYLSTKFKTYFFPQEPKSSFWT
jgi:hypothetical protein